MGVKCKPKGGFEGVLGAVCICMHDQQEKDRFDYFFPL